VPIDFILLRIFAVSYVLSLSSCFTLHSLSLSLLVLSCIVLVVSCRAALVLNPSHTSIALVTFLRASLRRAPWLYVVMRWFSPARALLALSCVLDSNIFTTTAIQLDATQPGMWSLLSSSSPPSFSHSTHLRIFLLTSLRSGSRHSQTHCSRARFPLREESRRRFNSRECDIWAPGHAAFPSILLVGGRCHVWTVD
jgi:hypothetical protein